MSDCALEIKSAQHFFLSCHIDHVEISELLDSIYVIYLATNELNEDSIMILGFIWLRLVSQRGKKITLNYITYRKVTKRFKEPLL